MKIEIQIEDKYWRVIASFAGRIPAIVEGDVVSTGADALYGATLAATNTVNTLVFREALKIMGQLPRNDWEDRPISESIPIIDPAALAPAIADIKLK